MKTKTTQTASTKAHYRALWQSVGWIAALTLIVASILGLYFLPVDTSDPIARRRAEFMTDCAKLVPEAPQALTTEICSHYASAGIAPVVTLELARLDIRTSMQDHK